MFSLRTLSLCLALALLLSRCGQLERDNLFDPEALNYQSPPAVLALLVPLSKPLVSVVHRVVATLEGPDTPPIVKELKLSPLGPASGTIGTIQPGTGLTLTLRGYDLNGELLFEGQMENITIAAGDTTRIELELRLVRPPPDDPSGEEPPPDDTTGDTADAGGGDPSGEEPPPDDTAGDTADAGGEGSAEDEGEASS